MLIFVIVEQLIEVNEGCCQHDNAFYSCTAGVITIWDITDEMENLVLSQSVSVYEHIGTHFTKMIQSSIVEVELTTKNATHVSSSLELYETQPLVGYHILCNDEKIVISRRNSK